MEKDTDNPINQQLAAAYQAHREGRFSSAREKYQEILKHLPGNREALNGLGNLFLDQDLPEKAKPVFETAANLDPPDLSACYNLARLKQLENDHAGAIPIYKKMLGQQPDVGQVWNNLGVALRETGFPDDALASFNNAVRFAPDMAEAWNNLGVAQDEHNQSQDAIASYQKAIELHPDYLSPHLNLGIALQKNDQFKAAERHYQQVLKIQPGHEVAMFMLQSIQGEETPDAAPVAHVRNIFDQCAENFESILVDDLAYKTPELLFNLIQPFLTTEMNILDLGCGTGLGAQLYQPFARHLTGVDVSFKMLEKAEEKKIYHHLEVFDILQEWDFAHPFDLIYSSDVFVYFGNLEVIIKSAASYLSNNGILAFSVEKLDSNEANYKLFPSGRYAHTQAYIQTCLEKHGLQLKTIRQADVRNQSGKPVKGLLVVATR